MAAPASAPRDTTYDALSGKLEKTLPGFGEIFRMLSYEQVGAAAILSRATAGVYRGRVVISTPGSPAAVRLAWEKLIAPEIQHLAWEVVRERAQVTRDVDDPGTLRYHAAVRHRGSKYDKENRQ